MAKYNISYRAYPSSAEATNYSMNRATFGFYVGGIISLFILGSIFYYIVGVISLFAGFDYLFYLKSLGVFLAASLVALYFFMLRERITERNCRLIILREYAEDKGATPDEIKYLESQVKAQSRTDLIGFAKSFYLVFIPAVISGTGLIGCATSVLRLCHKKGGLIGLIVSLIILIAATIYYIARYVPHDRHPKENKKMRLTKDSPKETPNSASVEIAFCRKCGAKVYSDSIFCAKCGCKIIR